MRARRERGWADTCSRLTPAAERRCGGGSQLHHERLGRRAAARRSRRSARGPRRWHPSGARCTSGADARARRCTSSASSALTSSTSAPSCTTRTSRYSESRSTSERSSTSRCARVARRFWFSSSCFTCARTAGGSVPAPSAPRECSRAARSAASRSRRRVLGLLGRHRHELGGREHRRPDGGERAGELEHVAAPDPRALVQGQPAGDADVAPRRPRGEGGDGGVDAVPPDQQLRDVLRPAAPGARRAGSASGWSRGRRRGSARRAARRCAAAAPRPPSAAGCRTCR